MTVYGYARVSTLKQDYSEQIEELVKKGVPAENINAEKYTGPTTVRPVFNKLVGEVQAGDKLVVTKLDRFARNLEDGLRVARKLRDKGVVFEVGNIGTISNDPNGQLIFNIFSSFAQFERELIVQRTREGREYAREHDPNYTEGRPKKGNKASREHAYELLKAGHSYKEVAKMTEFSRSTLQRIKKEMEPTA